MDPQLRCPAGKPAGGTPRKAWPMVVFAAMTSCQLLFGDFDIVSSGAEEASPLSMCTEASTYRCDGITLYVCVESGQAPTRLLDCEAPLECDATDGRCVGDDTDPASATSAQTASSTTTTGVGGSSSPVNAAASDGSSTDGAAGAPPDSGECDPLVDDCCPDDPDKTGPGLCGCGVIDTSECAALRAALVHRYSFNEVGSAAMDAVSGDHGKLVNVQIQAAGSLELAGADSDQYVNLPNGIISVLTNATVEAWLVWHGGDSWQRVFDFGNNDSGEDAQGTGTTYLFLTPNSSASTLRVAFTADGPGSETIVETAAPMATETATHVAVVVDADNDALSLYVDGIPQGTAAFSGQLSMLDDVNNWLGKSQFSADPELGATLDELRIYRAALTEAQVAASYQGGPDPAFFAF